MEEHTTDENKEISPKLAQMIEDYAESVVKQELLMERLFKETNIPPEILIHDLTKIARERGTSEEDIRYMVDTVMTWFKVYNLGEE